MFEQDGINLLIVIWYICVSRHTMVEILHVFSVSYGTEDLVMVFLN